MSGGGRITQLLGEIKSGSPEALGELLPLVYEELRSMARAQLSRERVGHTLGPTALVHEAYLRLHRQHGLAPQSRPHFFAIASQTMRRVLVDYARARKRLKRGGEAEHVPLDEAQAALTDDMADEVLALDAALERLSRVNERGSRVVELRYFGGLTVEEAAEALGMSERTVYRSWEAARAWLRKEIDAELG